MIFYIIAERNIYINIYIYMDFEIASIKLSLVFSDSYTWKQGGKEVNVHEIKYEKTL